MGRGVAAPVDGDDDSMLCNEAQSALKAFARSREVHLPLVQLR